MLPSLIASLASVLGCNHAAFILAVDTDKRVCPYPMIPASDVQDRRHLTGYPLAHEPMLGLVFLQELGIAIQSAAHSTAITLENLVM